VWYKW